MPRLTKKRNVSVQATLSASGDYEFAMFEEDDDRRVKLDKLIFDKKKDGLYKIGWYVVEFTLERPRGSDLRFHEDIDEIFWIGPPVGKACCPEPYSRHDPITAVRVSDRKIKVRNPDNRREDLAFALGFQDGDDSTPIRYDPLWGNQNGGHELSAVQALAAGASVAGLLALVGWAATKALGSSPKRRKRR